MTSSLANLTSKDYVEITQRTIANATVSHFNIVQSLPSGTYLVFPGTLQVVHPPAGTALFGLWGLYHEIGYFYTNSLSDALLAAVNELLYSKARILFLVAAYDANSSTIRAFFGMFARFSYSSVFRSPDTQGKPRADVVFS